MKHGNHEQIAKAEGIPLEKIEEQAAKLAKETTLQEM